MLEKGTTGSDYISQSSMTSMIDTAFEGTVAEITRNQIRETSFADAVELMAGDKFRIEHRSRNSIAIALVEAETIRRILHVRSDVRELIDDSCTEVGLRMIGSNNYLIDSSKGYTDSSPYQEEVTWQAFRFMDCETHFRDRQLNYLLKFKDNLKCYVIP